MPISIRRFNFATLLFVASLCFSLADHSRLTEDELTEVIPDLYQEYRNWVENGTRPKPLRRVFKNNAEYDLHVQKLKEVNGFKRHNIIVKRKSSNVNPLVYISNPVETKVPNSYLTLEEFKRVLTERVKEQRSQFDKPGSRIHNIFRHTTSSSAINKVDKTTLTLKIVAETITHLPKVKLEHEEDKKVLTNTSVTSTVDVTEAIKNDTYINKTESVDELTESIVTDIMTAVNESAVEKPLQVVTSKEYLTKEVVPEFKGFIATTEVTFISDNTDKLLLNMKTIEHETLREIETESTIKVERDSKENRDGSTVIYNFTPKHSTTKRTALSRPLVFMGGYN